MKTLLWATALAASALNVAHASSYTTVTIPQLTDDIRTWGDGGLYAPLFPSSQTFAGVPFSLQLDSSGHDVFEGVAVPGVQQVTINVGVTGVTDVYTLINTAYGVMNAEVGSITFNGSAGATYTVKLVEGDNVRDHLVNVYVNTTTADYVTHDVYGTDDNLTAHLDMQDFKLPDAFKTQKLSTIVFSSTGGDSQGNPFLAGLTVLSTNSPALGGTVTGAGLKSVTCNNVTTGKSLTIKSLKGATSWDCAAAGLAVHSGDVVKETLNGTAQ